MKIFFNASLTGKREYGENYQKIVDSIKRTQHVLIYDQVLKRIPEDVAKESSDEATNYYRFLKGKLAESDLVVFEVSYPSTGLGHEITMALEMGKPVIALHVKGRPPYVLESIPSDKLQVLEYAMEDLTELIIDAIKYAEEQVDARFNFFISPQIQHYLDWISRKKMTPRAVHLRNLLEKDMEENKEYKQELAGGK